MGYRVPAGPQVRQSREPTVGGDHEKARHFARSRCRLRLGVRSAVGCEANQHGLDGCPVVGAEEVPKQVVKNPSAHGLFKGTLTGTSLKFTLTFAEPDRPCRPPHTSISARRAMSGATSSFRSAARPCKSPVTGTVTVSAALQSDFKEEHLLYVNVHTAKNPNGEIREAA